MSSMSKSLIGGVSGGGGGGGSSSATSRLCRADSDASERAPLISTGSSSKGNHKGGGSTSSYDPHSPLLNPGDNVALIQQQNKTPTPATFQPAGGNKNPRMVFATGYLRKSSNASLTGAGGSSSSSHPDGQFGEPLKTSSASSNPEGAPAGHEYQTISDEEFGGPLDLGPSLMDEVFSELDSSKDSGMLCFVFNPDPS